MLGKLFVVAGVILFQLLQQHRVLSSTEEDLQISGNIAVLNGSVLEIVCYARNSSGIFVDFSSSADGGTWAPLAGLSGLSLDFNNSRFTRTLINSTHLRIIINPALIKDAGAYRCGVPGQNPRLSNRVVILETQTQCDSTFPTAPLQELQEVEMTCSVSYRGIWPPTLEWQDSSGRVVNDDRQHLPETARVTRRLKLKANASDNGAVYRCVTKFENTTDLVLQHPTNKNIYPVQNIPTYRHVCNATALTVLYSPRSVAITPRQYQYKTGDKIYCSAKGYPAPTIHWIKVFDLNGDDGPKEVDGSELKIDADYEGREHTFICIANNSVGSTANASITFNVTFPETSTAFITTIQTSEATTLSDDSSSEAGGGSMGVPLMIGLVSAVAVASALIVGAFMCMKFRQHNKHPEPDVVQDVEKRNSRVRSIRAVSQVEPCYEDMDPEGLDTSSSYSGQSSDGLLYEEVKFKNTKLDSPPLKSQTKIKQPVKDAKRAEDPPIYAEVKKDKSAKNAKKDDAQAPVYAAVNKTKPAAKTVATPNVDDQPVYAQVNKKKPAAKPGQKKKKEPEAVYGNVDPENEYACVADREKARSPRTPAAKPTLPPSKPSVTVGEVDGTIYAMLDDSARPARPSIKHKPVVVAESDYAAIDHTAKLPPQPPEY